MNDNAKAWVATLRSGDYSQTYNALHDNMGFCCLGVACDISELGHWDNWEGDTVYVVGDGKDVGNNSFLPSAVREWLGLTDTSGTFSTPDYDDSLVSCNDRGCSFDEIADLIEREPKGLFAE